MAMTSSGLKAAILAQMASQGFDIANSAYGDQYISALSTAIVTYLQANATITDEAGTYNLQ